MVLVHYSYRLKEPFTVLSTCPNGVHKEDEISMHVSSQNFWNQF
jgi:hypothetical protein